MNRLKSQILSNKMSLIVSLPGQTEKIAKAAWEAGADALKMHLNVDHFASGLHFGTLDEEEATIKAVLNTVDIPVGIVPGETEIADGTIHRLADMGVDFFDIYAHFFRTQYLSVKGISTMAAIGPGYTVEDAQNVGHFVDIMELSILPHSEYGKPLMLADIARYRQWLDRLPGKAIVIPSQKAICPEDVPWLYEAGVRCIMIGAMATGKTEQGVYETTRAFRRQIDTL